MKRKLLLLLCALLATVGTWAETDVTTYLSNPDFSNGKDGWTGIKDDSGTNKNTSFVLVNNTTFGKGGNDKNAEMWIAQDKTLGAGDINQTLSNVTAGVYRLTVKVRTDIKFYLYASINDVEQSVFFETSIASPGEERSLLFVVKETSNVKIGVKHSGASINTYNWIAVDDFKLYREGDLGPNVEVTNQIVNWDFLNCTGGWNVETNFPGWTVSNPNSGNAWAHNVGGLATAVEYYKDPATGGSFDYYQTIAGLPKGKYTLSASMWHTQGTVSGECGVYGSSSNGDAFAGVTDDCGDADLHTYTTDGVLVTDGSMQVGVKNTATMHARWFGVDWIKLFYHGNNIEYYSPANFTSNTEATADSWYEFDIATAGTYKIESSGNITFYYTQDNSDDADGTASASITASGYTALGLTSGKLYFKSSAKSTITISFLVPDGTYYLYDATNKLFLGRGADNGTRATVDKYGIPFTWSNTTKLISFVDWDGRSLFFDKNNHAACWLYTDGASSWGDDRLMAFTDAGDGKVYLQDAAKAVWIKHDNSVLNVPVTSASTATKWTIMTKAEHDAIVNAYPTNNISSVITAAGISATVTTSTFENYLSTKCRKSDLTSVIRTANFDDDNGDWTVTEVTNANFSKWIAYGNGYARYYQVGVTVSQTIDKANLPAGIYKVSMAGFDRRGAANSVNTVDIALGNEFGSVCNSYLKANGEQVRIKSWKETLYDVKKCNGNESWETQKAALDDGTCENVLYIYLDGNTDLTLTVARPNLCSGNYISFGKFKLTRYVYDNKVETITTNKGDITSLINGDFQENADGWTGGGRVTWVGSESWRGGSDNVYYERTNSGALSYTLANMPAGTYKLVAASRGYDGGKIVPEIAGTTGDELSCVGNSASEGRSEINLNGVEMPYSSLGGFTTYEKGHNWRWITATGTLASAGDLVINFNCTGTDWMAIDDVHLYCTELDGVEYTQTLSTIDDNTEVDNTGNRSVVTCDLAMSNPNAIISSSTAINGAAGAINNNLVSGTIANMVLYDGYNFTAPVGSYAATAAKLYRSIAANKWISLVLPFVPTTKFSDKKAPSGLSEGTLSFADATLANDAPMMVRNTSVISEIVGARADGTTGNLKAGEGAPMVGVYEAGGFVPVSVDGATRYVVSGNQLHKVTSEVSIKPFRAYFELIDSKSPARLVISFDGEDPTGINAVEATETEAGTLKDGKYLINGKIVLVKNGVKYDANGQKLN